jgi:hypothetical protein
MSNTLCGFSSRSSIVRRSTYALEYKPGLPIKHNPISSTGLSLETEYLSLISAVDVFPRPANQPENFP